MADRVYTHAGRLYEWIGEYGICTLLMDLQAQDYLCATKARIEDIQIYWQLACVFTNKPQAVKFAQEVDTMYSEMRNRALVENVGRKLDEEIGAHGSNMEYDFDAALDETQKEYSMFDICTAVALTIERASEWDGRYNSANVKWAKDFLFENDIDAEEFKSVRLCNTHPIKISALADMLEDKVKTMNAQDMLAINEEELDLTQQERTR